MRHEEHHILAAVDPESGSEAVRVVAEALSLQFDAPVRELHVVAGPGERGAARQAALARVERGETAELLGRPVDILASLVESPHALATVLGTGNPAARPNPRRPGGTAFSVARRVSRPLVLVPPGIDKWAGAKRVLVPLDGTGITALAASAGLATISVPETVATTVHVFDERTVPPFWDNPQHEYEAWTKEFKARYCETIGEGLEVRSGPVGDQVTSMTASGDYDLVVVVWSQQTRGGRAGVVMDLLAGSPVPLLLVPSGFVTHALGGALHPPGPEGE